MKHKHSSVLSGGNQSQILSRIQVKTLFILIFHDREWKYWWTAEFTSSKCQIICTPDGGLFSILKIFTVIVIQLHRFPQWINANILQITYIDDFMTLRLNFYLMLTILLASISSLCCVKNKAATSQITPITGGQNALSWRQLCRAGAGPNRLMGSAGFSSSAGCDASVIGTPLHGTLCDLVKVWPTDATQQCHHTRINCAVLRMRV